MWDFMYFWCTAGVFEKNNTRFPHNVELEESNLSFKMDSVFSLRTWTLNYVFPFWGLIFRSVIFWFREKEREVNHLRIKKINSVSISFLPNRMLCTVSVFTVTLTAFLSVCLSFFLSLTFCLMGFLLLPLNSFDPTFVFTSSFFFPFSLISSFT